MLDDLRNSGSVLGIGTCNCTGVTEKDALDAASHTCGYQSTRKRESCIPSTNSVLKVFTPTEPYREYNNKIRLSMIEEASKGRLIYIRVKCVPLVS